MKPLPLSLVLLLVPLVPHVRAEDPPRSFDVATVDRYIAAQVKAKGLIGLSVAIIKDGEIAMTRGYGLSSQTKGTAVQVDTLFALGSVTKQFTCACILLLAEDGKLSVNDPVARWYPKLTRAHEITLLDLMTHVSGYPDYYPLDFIDQRLEKPRAIDDILAEYAGGKLDFEPRTRYSYSNTGYLLLGRVIERVSGQSFETFLEKRIFEPLGMRHATLNPLKKANVATGYTSFALADPTPATPEADGWLHAAGGLYASAADVARWNLGLMSGKLLKPESYKIMTSPRELKGGKVKTYGCGLGIQLRGGETILRHGGAVSGFLTTNTLLPRTRSGVVLLNNAEHTDTGSIHETLLAMLLRPEEGPDVRVPKISGQGAADAAQALFLELQKGKVDRTNLGTDYSRFLSEEKVNKAAERLSSFGPPETVAVEGLSERGGMEVAVIKLTFKKGSLKGLLYRTPDGKIQEFLITR